MLRKLRDIIPAIPPQLKPRSIDSSAVQEDIMKRREKSKIQYDRKASQTIKGFDKEDCVWVKPRQENKPWIYGKVIEKPDERSCVVQTPVGLMRRNRKHIRKVKVNSQDGQTQINLDIEIISLPESEEEKIVEERNDESPGGKNPATLPEEEEQKNEGVSTLRRSNRVRIRPDKYKD